MTESTNK